MIQSSIEAISAVERVADDAERGKPVQDRPRVARLRRRARIGVQRVVVTVETVEERLFRPRREVDRAIGCVCWKRVRRFRRSARAAEAAVGAQECRRVNRRDARSGRRVGDAALGVNERATARPAVDDTRHARDPKQVAFDRQPAMKLDARFAVEGLREVGTVCRIGEPVALVGEDARHRRERDEVARGIDERELVRVERILSEADGERVERGAAARERLPARDVDGEEPFVIEGHCDPPAVRRRRRS